MLVIGRRTDQAIIITVGDIEVRVKICRIRGRQVYIGIDAPPERVHVRREELPEWPPEADNAETISDGGG